jgi:hypothetical protein
VRLQEDEIAYRRREGSQCLHAYPVELNAQFSALTGTLLGRGSTVPTVLVMKREISAVHESSKG